MLDKLRNQINKIDRSIIDLIAKRMSISKKIGKLKTGKKSAVLDDKREKEVIKNWQSQSFVKKIDPVFIKKLIDLIMKESKNIQRGRF